METRASWKLPDASSEEFARLLHELAETNAPRRFALCEVDAELPDARILAWGLADDDEAVVVAIEESWFGRFKSAESAQQMFSRIMECRLIWIDEARDEEAA